MQILIAFFGIFEMSWIMSLAIFEIIYFLRCEIIIQVAPYGPRCLGQSPTLPWHFCNHSKLPYFLTFRFFFVAMVFHFHSRFRQSFRHTKKTLLAKPHAKFGGRQTNPTSPTLRQDAPPLVSFGLLGGLFWLV